MRGRGIMGKRRDSQYNTWHKRGRRGNSKEIKGVYSKEIKHKYRGVGGGKRKGHGKKKGAGYR